MSETTPTPEGAREAIKGYFWMACKSCKTRRCNPPEDAGEQLCSVIVEAVMKERGPRKWGT
jgi:hypothetical protein